MNGDMKKLQETSLETLMSGIGRVNPSISGSTASLIAAQIASAMVRMALSVSSKHGSDNGLAIERLDSIVSRIKETAERDREASSRLIGWSCLEQIESVFQRCDLFDIVLALDKQREVKQSGCHHVLLSR